MLVNIAGASFIYDQQHLINVSGYFETLLGNSTFSKDANQELCIYGPLGNELTPQAFEFAVGYSALNTVLSVNNLTESDLNEVMLAIDYLQISRLSAIAERILKNSISHDTWIQIFMIAKHMEITRLESACLQYFRRVRGDLDYTKFQSDEFMCVLETLQNTTWMQCAFEAVLAWAEQVQDDRNLNYLLSYIDYKLLDTSFIQHITKNSEVLLRHPNIIEDISKATLDRRLLLIGGFNNSTKSVVKYCPYKNEPTSCPQPPYSCDSSAVTRCGNIVVVAGGKGDSMSLLQIYDLDSEKWSVSTCRLQQSRFGASSEFVNNRLFVMGGSDGSSCLSSIEIFDVKNKECFAVTPSQSSLHLSTARTQFSTSLHDDEIYVMGGLAERIRKNAVNRLSSCEVLNTSSLEIKEMSPMKKQRSSHASVIADNSIICLGGFVDGLSTSRTLTVERYSFVTETWSFMPSLKIQRAGHSAYVFDGVVYIFGGNFPVSVERYDLVSSSTFFSRLIAFITHDKKNHIHELDIPAFHHAVVQV